MVLAGQPNVGKSSLLNALAGAELAIVTPIAGTTRDKVSQTIQIDGVPLHVIDTAGLRELDPSGDEVERIGIARSWTEIEAADAVVFLHDLDAAWRGGLRGGRCADRRRIAAHHDGVDRVLQVCNKVDLLGAAPRRCLRSRPARCDGAEARARCRRRAGAVRPRCGSTAAARLLELAGWQAQPEGLFIARTRHVHALRRTREHIELAQAHAAQSDAALDLLAEELRLAHDALGEITGQFTADDLLGEIFGRFCIGK